MINLITKLSSIWEGTEHPFLIHEGEELYFKEIVGQTPVDLSKVKNGDVVALIGDFDPSSIHTFLSIIDMDLIVVPLTQNTKEQHEYFFESALVDVVIEGGAVRRIAHGKKHELIDSLRKEGHAGLVLFSTGTTGRPKAILHDLTIFLKRYETPRQTLVTLNFLLFDHIGGLNTLLHTLFNKGIVIAPNGRDVESILKACTENEVEALPTTPTFLRMMLMSGAVPSKIPPSLKIITYGTERMDQSTLDEFCRLLPRVDFRQTFGMSELGIVRVKSEARDSLFMKIGGEGVETKVVEGVLHIRSQSHMLGYLNAELPFDAEGWYDTKDVVEERDGFYKVTGRIGDVINVGGLKFMASEVERVALQFPKVSLVKAYPKDNPITGQHVEIIIQPSEGNELDRSQFKAHMREALPSHMVPRRYVFDKVAVGHRFKIC